MKIKTFFKIFMIAACFFASRAAANENDIYVFVWAEYIPEGVFSRFTQETGVNVHASTFDNLDDMYAKIKITGGKGYDVVMASTEYMALMKRQNLLHKLDKEMLPNLQNIHPMFLNLSFDPQNDYTVPFAVGTSTFAVATDRVDASALKKLADLGRPELKGRLILLNDVRAVFGIGLLMNGYTVNETDEARLAQAYKSLQDVVLPNVKAYNTEATIQALINGEADVVMTWNGLQRDEGTSDDKRGAVQGRRQLLDRQLRGFGTIAKRRRRAPVFEFSHASRRRRRNIAGIRLYVPEYVGKGVVAGRRRQKPRSVSGLKNV